MLIFKLMIFLFFIVSQHYAATPKKRDTTKSLSERIEKLRQLTTRKPIIRLDAEKFRTFVGTKSLPRNYSFVVMMTALSPHRECQICRAASEEYSIVANSWYYFTHGSNEHSDKLFFGLVDYDEGSEVFKMLGIASAPVFLFFSEKGKIKGADQMDVGRIGFAAETIGKWISEKSDVQIRVIRPPNYSGAFLLIGIGVLFGTLVYVKRNNLDFLYNRTSWALIATMIVFTMTSGQMWNHIRGPPLMHKSSKGVLFVHGSSSGQFVIETYIVIILNAAIAFGVYLMNESLRGKGNNKRRKTTAVIGLVFAFFFFSLLLSIFRSKAQGYPYTLFFK